MLELTESLPPASIDPQSIDDRSDAELDALSCGVIGLDEEGTVLRYNLYESRLARLDRNQVLGRIFFGEVAPCTRGPAFEGRFRDFVARGATGVQRFDFVFDFAWGSQEVTVEIVRAPAAPRFYLLINRKRVGAPRPHFPRELQGALQRELAPDEGRQGVRRDALERRFLEVPAPFFGALRATCERLAPETFQLFSAEWGVQWGRRAAIDLEGLALETRGASLRDLPMREAAGFVAEYLAARGWGSPAFDFAAAREGVLAVEIERSALAEAAPRSRRASGELACHLVAGYFSAVLSALAGRRLAAREVACIAGGAERCTILVVGHERRAALDTALRDGTRGADALRLALRRAPRESQR